MVHLVYEPVTIIVSIFLSVLGAATIIWMMEAWREDDELASGIIELPEATSHRTTISLLVPARHETAVLEQTIEGVLASSYTNFEIVLIVGDDDPDTAAIAWKLANDVPGIITVAVDSNPNKSKPSALNVGLQVCSGDIVGVFDAEDDISPHLLGAVVERFDTTGAAIVQGGVQLMNTRSRWFSVRNCLEYYLWYRSRLHWHVRSGGFIPLGGNTVFIRRLVLERAGGWDESCLTEDCELGIRLGIDSAPVEIVYSPETATREETPLDFGSFIRQRTRWGQGFLQVFKKGTWLRLPSRTQRFVAIYTLLTPVWQALTVLAIPVAILGITSLKVGVNVAILTLLPALMLIWTTFLDAIALRQFGRDFGVKVGVRDIGMLAVSTLPYQLILSYSGMRAVWREIRKRTDWEKTDHAGAHRSHRLLQAGSPRPVQASTPLPE